MAALDRILTAEEVLSALREKAKEADEFRIKIWRRLAMGSPELKASFSGAVVGHFASPELWLPQLCGGGKYQLQGFHVSDPDKCVGGFMGVSISGDPTDVDMDAPSRPAWRGPAQLDFPPRAVPRHDAASMGYDIGHVPPAPGPGDSATRTQAWPRPAGGIFSPTYGASVPEREYDRDQRRQAALESERRQLERERLETRDATHRAELERLQKQHENDLRTLRAEIRSEIQAKPQGPDSTVLILQKMLETQAEDRRAAALQAAEDRRAAEARQAANDDRFNRLLEKMAERPKEDPLAVIEKVTGLIGKNNNNEAQMKMMHSMAEMHSVQMGSAMDFIQAAADMQLGNRGEGESPIVKGIEAAVRGIGAMAKGAARRPVPQQQALPPQTQQTAPQQQQARPRPPAPPPPPPQELPPVLVQIEWGIQGKHPPAAVVDAMMQHYADPSIQGALAEYGMDFEAAIRGRLAKWIAESPENEAYVQALCKELEERLAKAGLFDSAPEEDGQEEGGEEGDEGDDE